MKNTNEHFEKRNLRVDEFSKQYGICRTKVYQEIKHGRLKPFKCGKTTLISREAAEDWQRLLSEGS